MTTLSAIAGDDNGGTSAKVSVEIVDKDEDEISDEDCAALKESARLAFRSVFDDDPQSIIVWVE